MFVRFVVSSGSYANAQTIPHIIQQTRNVRIRPMGRIEIIDADFSDIVFTDDTSSTSDLFDSDFARQQFLSTTTLDNYTSPQTLPQFFARLWSLLVYRTEL
ncbi:hypothetical protein QLX08_011654 [Tetragonisca angustula]|uniref:Uncharacterized protein n=1 Tax=Tetragonisca angustula TaxID=166442 RepID=A0AAW0Z7Q6_9HYME